jgi:RNA polymerase sigma-70 factor (ECF subfamily)
MLSGIQIMRESGREFEAVESHHFVTTHWSVVAAAGREASPTAQAALEILARTYWYPLYAYVRRKGHDEHAAKDLTQEFFARLFARNDFARLDRERGKFRAFLLASLNHFLAKEWRDQTALKRGGGQTVLSLDAAAEGWYLQEPATDETPEKLYDRRWAMTILESAATRLRDEFVASDKAEQFDALRIFLSDATAAHGYQQAASQLQWTTGAVATAVHRLRQRYREMVRQEIAQTVTTPLELEEEMHHLLEVLT